MSGRVLAVKIIEVSRRRRRLIMSERQAMREWRAERKKSLIEELEEGEVRTGVISSVAEFGAFVDLGGADGLVHVSEITHERGKHPRDVVHVGQEVQVYVLSVDRERKRIGLSLKRLQRDPWLVVEEDHYVGELVEGVISNLAKFGAFVRLDDGLEGLVHISELADQRVEHPKDVVRAGQRVTAEVISIDSMRRRLGLSLRRVPDHLRVQDGGPEAESELPVPEPADQNGPEAETELPVAEPADSDGPAEAGTELPTMELADPDAPALSSTEVPPEEAVDAPTDDA
jgi:small subunit ribosomal protein S1